jgi:hypothetical protein
MWIICFRFRLIGAGKNTHSLKEEHIMARHKKHERMKELARKRHRREKALKARVKEAKAAAGK